jgi:hypothetical protein
LQVFTHNHGQLTTFTCLTAVDAAVFVAANSGFAAYRKS